MVSVISSTFTCSGGPGEPRIRLKNRQSSVKPVPWNSLTQQYRFPFYQHCGKNKTIQLGIRTLVIIVLHSLKPDNLFLKYSEL